MQKIQLIIILFFLSCDYKPESIGVFNEILILASPEDKKFVKPIIEELFDGVVYTPQDEKVFDLKFVDPWSLNSIQNHGNIILTSLNFPEDSTGDLLAKRILFKNKETSNIIVLDDFYSENQLFSVFRGLDAIDFQNNIKNNRKWILNQYNSLFENRIKKEIFNNGKNKVLSKNIMNILGYSIDLQIDFQLIKSDSINSFVWVGRGYPYRWITLHKTKKEYYLTAESAWNNLNISLEIFMPDVKISENFKNNYSFIYNEKRIPMMRGIYEHSESETGGPFFVYIFETEQANEVILISGFVNYPGHKKILLLKQLEIMAKTLYKEN
tara:strand:+ start:573 stop:1547 length:975 start_codon:yes stop_codon:yes gene_type:complete